MDDGGSSKEISRILLASFATVLAFIVIAVAIGFIVATWPFMGLLFGILGLALLARWVVWTIKD